MSRNLQTRRQQASTSVNMKLDEEVIVRHAVQENHPSDEARISSVCYRDPVWFKIELIGRDFWQFVYL